MVRVVAANSFRHQPRSGGVVQMMERLVGFLAPLGGRIVEVRGDIFQHLAITQGEREMIVLRHPTPAEAVVRLRRRHTADRRMQMGIRSGVQMGKNEVQLAAQPFWRRRSALPCRDLTRQGSDP